MANKVKVQAIIQARTGSKRLPNKIFLPLSDKPVIEHVYDRTRFSFSLDRIVIATTSLPEDKKIVDWCKQKGIYYICGSESDVLSRFINALNEYGSEYIVRITADCPLVDPGIIDILVGIAITNNYDYVSNVHPPTFPAGFDVEVIKSDILFRINKLSNFASQREHVTLYIRENSELFKIYNLTAPNKLLKYCSCRFTLDYYEDYIFLNKISDKINLSHTIPSIYEIIRIVDSCPQITEINRNIDRFTGLKESAKIENRRINLSYINSL